MIDRWNAVLTGTCDRSRGFLEVRHPVPSAPQLTLPDLPGMVQPMAAYRYPRTSEEFAHRFASEAACLDYVAALRWSSGFRCPRPGCAFDRVRRTAPGRWVCVRCGHPVCAVAGTIFEGSRLPLTLWLKSVWLMASRDGISANQLQRELPLGNYRTATRCLHTLRQTMVPAGPPTRLWGEVAVQVFEYKRRFLAITMTLGRERGLRIRRLPDRSPNSLRTFVRETVVPRQTVWTADMDLYDALRGEDYDYWMTGGRLQRWGPEWLHWYGVNSVVPGVDRIVRHVMKWSRDLHRYAESDGLFLECLEEFVFRYKYPRACSRWKQLLKKALALEPDR